MNEAQRQVTGPMIFIDGGAGLVGRVVRWRPYYHVPISSGGARESVRSPWTQRATVIQGTTSDNSVILEFSGDYRGPWPDRVQAFIRELHDVNDCACPACVLGGGGIHEQAGA